MTPEEFIEHYMKGSRNQYFYHFTDKANFPLISQYGLLSVKKLAELNIKVPAPGGNDLSRALDKRTNMDGYVHLCLDLDHPMAYKAQKDGRITNIKFIGVSPIVLKREGVLFADKVANNTDVKLLTLQEACSGLMDFEVLYKRTNWKDEAIQKRLKIARKYELLIPNEVCMNEIKGSI